MFTWDTATVSTWLGPLDGLSLFAVSCIRRKGVDPADVGPAAVVFLASYNLGPPIVLFRFAADPALRATLPPAMSGYEKYLALAAFCSLMLTLCSMVVLYSKAWKQAP